ncbi:MAG: hypothetical protein V1835_00135 [Candidatus Micrarchaeota archaeon]
MRRGQAFETMMLVISVIVALAILGVLLNIIGVIPGIGVSDPRTSIKDGFQQLQGRGGIGIISPKKVTFTAGDKIVRSELVSQLSIQATQVKFFCAEDGICGGSNSPLDIVDEKTIDVIRKVEVYIVTCANEQNGKEYNYCATIASTSKAKEATDKCTTECGVE